MNRKIKEIDINVFRKRVTDLRTSNGLIQKDMADIAGMTPQNYNNFERGRDTQKLTLNQVSNIAQHFGVTFEYVLGFSAGAKAGSGAEEEVKTLRYENERLNEKLAFTNRSLVQCEEINTLLKEKLAKVK